MKKELMELKNNIKECAIDNRSLKKEIKDRQKAYKCASSLQYKLHYAKIKTRALLRAYGALRGVPLEKIEPHCKDTWIALEVQSLASKYIEEYTPKEEEAVHE